MVYFGLVVNLVFIFCNLEHFFVFTNLKESSKFPGINMNKNSTSLKFSTELRLAAGLVQTQKIGFYFTCKSRYFCNSILDLTSYTIYNEFSTKFFYLLYKPYMEITKSFINFSCYTSLVLTRN